MNRPGDKNGAAQAPAAAGGPLSAARLQSKLASMRRKSTEYRAATWPGLDLPLKLRLLSNADVQLCHAAALARFEAIGIPTDKMLSVDLFEDEVMLQVLHRACRDPEKPDELTFADDADDLRENTTVDQRAEMFTLYRDFQADYDPRLDAMPAAVVEQIVEALKKKDQRLLRSFGARALSSFLLSGGNPQST